MKVPIVWHGILLSILMMVRVFSSSAKLESQRKIRDKSSAGSKITHTFEPRKKTSYFPLYWLVNSDPYNIYNGLL